jgi:hypothetical protein
MPAEYNPAEVAALQILAGRYSDIDLYSEALAANPGELIVRLLSPNLSF